MPAAYHAWAALSMPSLALPCPACLPRSWNLSVYYAASASDLADASKTTPCTPGGGALSLFTCGTTLAANTTYYVAVRATPAQGTALTANASAST